MVLQTEITIKTDTNLDELDGYIQQVKELLKKIESFKIKANFNYLENLENADKQD